MQQTRTRVIGFSASYGDVTVVIIVEDGGIGYGANAWPANPRARRSYEKGIS